MSNHRSYTAGRYALELDNVSAGWVYSVEGGNRVGDVVVEKMSGVQLQKKHIGALKYEDISVTCGIGMSKKFYEWAKNSFSDNFKRHDGAIHYCDFDGNILQSLEFHQALVTEIGFPALDAASKDAAKLSLKFSPEWTRTKTNQKGKVHANKYPIGAGQQKKWSPANFRLRIDGLEEACRGINKIESLVLKQKVTENAVGEHRLMTKEPVGLEVPNLVVTVSASHSKPWWDWEKDFLIDGNCGDDMEKTATLEYLSNNVKDTLFTIHMDHVGLFKLTADKAESGAESIRRIKAEMYVEEFKFEFGSGVTWT
jgi:phage tail-like protein